MMPRDIYSWFQWFCAPTDLTTFKGFCLFTVSIVLVGFMSVHFYAVIIDNRALNENPMFEMVKEADAFMKHLKANVSGHRLLNDYQWLNDLKMLIGSDCHIQSTSLKHLHYTGYLMAVYNVVLMHILLNGILPVSILAVIPIITSFISSEIDSFNTILLGLFEFSQALISVIIMGIFLFLKERGIKSTGILEEDHDE